MGLGTYTYTADTEGAITLKQARDTVWCSLQDPSSDSVIL